MRDLDLWRKLKQFLCCIAAGRRENPALHAPGATDAGAASYASHFRERSSRFADLDINDRQSRFSARLCRDQVRVEQASDRAQGTVVLISAW